MKTLDGLCETLAASTNGNANTVQRYAKRLQRAGLIAADGEEVTAQDAAVLLLAVMGAERPADAAAAVLKIGTVPAIVATLTFEQAGIISSQHWAIEDLSILAGQGEIVNQLTRQFGAALTLFIQAWQADDSLPHPSFPHFFLVGRDLQAPGAMLYLPWPQQPGVQSAALFFGKPDDPIYEILNVTRPSVQVRMPGRVLRDLGDWLAERGPGAAKAPASAPVEVEAN